jgi:hypothetical protein
MRSVAPGDPLDFAPVDVLLLDLAPATGTAEVTAEQWVFVRAVSARNLLKPGGFVLLSFREPNP